MKTFTNSTAFQNGNYFYNEPFSKTLQKIKEEIKEPFVIIDGSDNINDPEFLLPSLFFPRKYVIAYYHSGRSGIIKSGVIVKEKNFKEIAENYKKTFGYVIDEKFKRGDEILQLNIFHSIENDEDNTL